MLSGEIALKNNDYYYYYYYFFSNSVTGNVVVSCFACAFIFVSAGIRHLVILVNLLDKAVKVPIFCILSNIGGIMDQMYGVAVTNKFSLFCDEDADPLEILRQTEEAKNVKKDSDKKKKTKKSIAVDVKPNLQEEQIQKTDGKMFYERSMNLMRM